MNIEAADIQSLFPGFDSLEKLQQTLATDASLPSSFTETLMVQLQQLQNVVSANKDIVPDSGTTVATAAAISASTGKHLPSDGNIDLEQTLTALSEIMGRLNIIQQSEPSTRQVQGADVNATDSEQTIGDRLQAVDKFQALGDLSLATRINAPDQSVQKPVQTIAAELQQTLENDPLQKVLASSVAKTERAQLQDAAQSLLQRQNSRQQNVLMNTASVPAQDTDIKQQAAEDLARSELLTSDKNQAQFSDVFKQNAGLSKGLMDEVGLEKKTKNKLQSIDSRAVLSGLAHLERSVMPAQDTRNSLPVVQTAITHPQWGQEFADKVVWLHQKAIPSAEINLNPRHLGPVSIHIDVDKEQANVSFQAHNPLVRDSIEAALPRLRDMLSAQNLNLGDVNVSQQQSGQKQSSNGFEQQTGQDDNKNTADSNLPHEAVADSAAAVMDEIEAGRAIVSQGLLSLFA